jgi:hypothetical protein
MPWEVPDIADERRINVGVGIVPAAGCARVAASSYLVFIALQARSSWHDQGPILRRGDYE